MMNELVTPLASFGISLLGGFLIGYGIRKVVKILLVISGLIIAFFVFLQGLGWVQPNFDKITVDATQFVNNTNLYSQLNTFTNNFSPFMMIGLAIGGVIGFVKAG